MLMLLHMEKLMGDASFEVVIECRFWAACCQLLSGNHSGNSDAGSLQGSCNDWGACSLGACPHRADAQARV